MKAVQEPDQKNEIYNLDLQQIQKKSDEQQKLSSIQQVEINLLKTKLAALEKLIMEK